MALHYPDSFNFLKAASELAQKTGALLEAYYLENADWFEASKISFSTQVSGYKGEILPLTEKQLYRESRALSERLKKMFLSYGERYQIKYTYSFVRGSSGHELVSEANQVDMVMIKRNNRAIGTERSLGPMVKNLAVNTETPLLIWSERIDEWPKSIISLCDTIEESIGIINWSLGLADRMGLKVHFFWSANIDIDSREFAESMEAQDMNRYVQLIKEQSENYPPTAFEYLQYHQKALVVLRRKEDMATVLDLIERLPNSVLLV